MILDSYECVENTESDMDEDHYNEEEQPSPPVQQKPITKWGLWSQADRHVSISLQAVTEERNRVKHCT
jgi:hypothetical protein